jgi:predicted ATP-grasp superfamily ATP-dependent carboligase
MKIETLPQSVGRSRRRERSALIRVAAPVPQSTANMPHPKVLLVSTKGSWAGLLRLPAMLNRAGAITVMYGPVDSRLRRSRYIRETYTAPAEMPAFIAGLREHLAHHQYSWVVLGDDPTLVAIAQTAIKDGDNWLEGWFPVDHEALEMIVSKTLFAEACPKYDVPLPRSIVCNTLEEVEAAAKDIGYPVMLKTAIGQAGNGVVKVEKAEELAAAFEPLKHRMPMVVQEFVVGQLGSTQMMFDQGVPICWVPAYKAMVYPEPFGPSCVRELLDQQGIDAMQPIVERIGAMTGFHGMCGIDWIRRADGSFAILEFNPRPTSTIHLGRRLGADCAIALKAMLAGRFEPQVPKECPRNQRKIYMFPQFWRRTTRLRKWRDLRFYVPFWANHDIPWEEPAFLLCPILDFMRKFVSMIF